MTTRLDLTCKLSALNEFAQASVRLALKMKQVPANHAVTKIVIVDDSKQFQQSLTRFLSSVSGIGIAGYAEDVASACILIDDLNPGVVLLDVELRSGDQGLDVLRYVVRKNPRPKVVVLSNLNWLALKRAYLLAGADAYFDKSLEFALARDWIAAFARDAGDAGKAG